MMNNDHDANWAIIKVLIAWAGTLFGGVTLSGMVMTATLIFTVLQIYVLIRRIIKEKP